MSLQADPGNMRRRRRSRVPRVVRLSEVIGVEEAARLETERQAAEAEGARIIQRRALQMQALGRRATRG